MKSIGRLVLALLVAAAPLGAQTWWRIPAALAGGFAGAGIGYMADGMAWDASSCLSCGPSLKMTTLGIGVGALAGFAGGLSADRKLARGDTLSGKARGWLRFATFLAPVAVGSALTFAIVNPSEPDCVYTSTYACTPYASGVSDEGVALLGIGGGAVAGLILQKKLAPKLWPRVSVRPDGRKATLSYSLTW